MLVLVYPGGLAGRAGEPLDACTDTGTTVNYLYLEGYIISRTTLSWQAGKPNSPRNLSKIWANF